MFTQIEVLEKLKKIIEEATDDLLLENGMINNGKYELVKPVVNIGYVPPKKLAFEGYTVPGVTLYIKEGEETEDEFDKINVLIGIQTYDPGNTIVSDEKSNTEYTLEGYKDILNVIQRIRRKLNNMSELDGLLIKKPLKWGFFDEQLYPYWAGYINLNIDICRIRRTELSKYL